MHIYVNIHILAPSICSLSKQTASHVTAKYVHQDIIPFSLQGRQTQTT